MEKRYRAAITAMRSDYSFQRELELLDKNGFDTDIVPLDATRDEARIISSMQEYEYILAGPELWSRRVIEALPKLRMIARLGTGTDAVDLDAAAERGVTVVNTPGANAGAVAQHTVALMLALSSGICAGDRRVRRGEPGKSVGRELSGATVGLVGFGDIAQRVADFRFACFAHCARRSSVPLGARFVRPRRARRRGRLYCEKASRHSLGLSASLNRVGARFFA